MPNVAGGWAQKEFERRRAKDRASIKTNLWLTIPFVLIASFVGGILCDSYIGGLGVLPGLVIAGFLGLTFWGSKQTTSAYGVGASVERLTAKALESLPGYVVLHDRKIPGSRANIDHVAIGPGRVFVVETKNYKDEVKVRGDDLLVGGHKRNEKVEQTWREAVNVQAALAEHMARLTIDLVPVLCIHGTAVEWAEVQGVKVVGPRGLKKLIAKAGSVLRDEDVPVLVEIMRGRMER